MTKVKLIFQFDRYKGYVDVDYDGEVSSIIHDPELITAVAEAKTRFFSGKIKEILFCLI